MEIKRRTFLGFFLLGSIMTVIAKKLGVKKSEQPREALFWRRKA